VVGWGVGSGEGNALDDSVACMCGVGGERGGGGVLGVVVVVGCVWEGGGLRSKLWAHGCWGMDTGSVPPPPLPPSHTHCNSPPPSPHEPPLVMRRQIVALSAANVSGGAGTSLVCPGSANIVDVYGGLYGPPTNSTPGSYPTDSVLCGQDFGATCQCFGGLWVDQHSDTPLPLLPALAPHISHPTHEQPHTARMLSTSTHNERAATHTPHPAPNMCASEPHTHDLQFTPL
jgi:hypothetical protein